MDPEQKTRRENTAAGTLGALLGALAGLVCIILTGRLQIVASLSGLVMSVCALKGYEKLAGVLSKKGAVIACVVILFMTYFAHHLDIALEIVEKLDMPLADAFVSIPKLLRLDLLSGAAFWGNLALLYLFAILGAVPTIRNSRIFSAASPLPVQSPAAQGAQEQPTPAECYAAGPLLSRPVRIDVRVIFALVLAFVLLGLAADAANAPHSRPGQDDPPRVSASEPDTHPAASIPGEDDPSEGAGSGAVGITPENYQSLFHLAEEYGYQYIGIGYLPVSADAAGENTFVPAYVPYCDAPVYSGDGRTLTTAAHGMQADITIMPTAGDARDAVEAMYEAFAASGADIYEGSVSETEYNEEYGIAVKHLFYFEENGTLPRMCFFYADEPFSGHCYAARIVYLTEQQDEEYPALVQELGDVFGLNLPEIDSFEP